MTAAAVPATHGEVWLRARPDGLLSTDHFEVVRVPVPEAKAGQVLVRNRLMSVAAVMRTVMQGGSDLPIPVAALGEPLWAPAVGEVVAAPGGELEPGAVVTHGLGWREYAVVDVADAERVDPSVLPDEAAYLSQAVTAWIGVVRGGEVRPGDTVFVTGAAGGVGTMAGQFARLRGAGRVIGSTGSRLKGDYLVRELGYDAVVIRGAGPIEEQLREAAPDGLDVVFDNVGGEQLVAALAVARRGARVALVGALSGQLAGGFTAPAGIDTGSLIVRGITLRGTSASDHLDAIPEGMREFGRGLREGTVVFPHARLSGIDQAPRALCELLEGRHTGAVLVEL
ncbi:NADP-dependent oxidoreductase [Streptomyces camponoticapitis]|uniref:NADP-dependent oxidoreductase n=1 Tax=Streptomyces camponoticapitis TaxID=1616125 RepID=A0ABQ2DYN8_9ACTN|nr:NADP-dependent oxidoreductase [Streptomyces camponoticapitis]GGJ78970.1 NADP-dependent oxidoreductase [Streptomyces camponoticapitis]